MRGDTMGLFNKLFGRLPKPKGKDEGYWQSLTAYTPVFQDWSGELYESDLVRAAVDARARHMSMLTVKVRGTARPKLQTRLRIAPNSWQTWSKFLYRMETILCMQNTCFLVPVIDDITHDTTGIYTILPSRCEFVQYSGELYLRYTFSNGQKAAIEFNKCGILVRHQYKDDYLGEKNTALSATMDLINLQHQGISEAIKNSNTFRFMARLSNFAKPEDIAKERKRFTEFNLRSDGGGLLLFPNTYNDIRQVESKSYVIDPETQKQIQTNVFNFYGVNEKIIQNTATGDDLDAFYSGAIDPDCKQFEEVATMMLFSEREQAQGSCVDATANRLKWLRTTEKIALIQQMGDRGMILIDEGRALLDWEPLPDGLGQKIPIRGEYHFLGEEEPADEQEKQTDPA